MKWTAIDKPKVGGCVIYRDEEYSFDTLEGTFSNADLLINDIHIGIDADTAEVVQLWGLSPKGRWKAMSCPLPPYREGRIVVSEIPNALVSTRINDKTPWREYYNPVSGWVCLDSGAFRFSPIECVCFIQNALALINEDKMLSLWMKYR